jgi:hypothetical protein
MPADPRLIEALLYAYAHEYTPEGRRLWLRAEEQVENLPGRPLDGIALYGNIGPHQYENVMLTSVCASQHSYCVRLYRRASKRTPWAEDCVVAWGGRGDRETITRWAHKLLFPAVYAGGDNA